MLISAKKSWMSGSTWAQIITIDIDLKYIVGLEYNSNTTSIFSRNIKSIKKENVWVICTVRMLIHVSTYLS